ASARSREPAPATPPSGAACARSPGSAPVGSRRHPAAGDAPEAPGAALTRVAPLIDVGINLAHDSYDHDRDAVLARAEAAGVVQMVITGSSGASTRQAAELEGLAHRPEVVAIGECGLDYFRNFSPQEAQRSAFHRQLELAARVGKPVFLHERDAHEDFVAILREHRAKLIGGVAHCFTGTQPQLLRYLELDLAIGIT